MEELGRVINHHHVEGEMQNFEVLETESAPVDVLTPEVFTQALQAQVDVSKRLEVPCAVLVARLEYQEVLEQLFGADGVGKVRRFFSHLLAHSVRDTDTVGWLEDGSLGIILRVISPQETSSVATRLQQEMSQQPVLVGEKNVHVAVQIGGVWYSGQRAMKPGDLTRQAIEALD